MVWAKPPADSIGLRCSLTRWTRVRPSNVASSSARQRPPGTQFPDDGADGVALGASAKTANLYSQGFREIGKLYGLRRGLYGLSLRLYGLARLFTGPGKDGRSSLLTPLRWFGGPSAKRSVLDGTKIRFIILILILIPIVISFCKLLIRSGLRLRSKIKRRGPNLPFSAYMGKKTALKSEPYTT